MQSGDTEKCDCVQAHESTHLQCIQEKSIETIRFIRYTISISENQRLAAIFHQFHRLALILCAPYDSFTRREIYRLFVL